MGEVDAVVYCAANAPTADLVTASNEDFMAGLNGKLLGQVRLVRTALHHLRDGGSFGALVNAGLEAFVRTAAGELPRGLRLNIVSPGWVRESLEAFGWDPAKGTPAAEVARAYVEAVEGTAQGEVVTGC